MFAERLFCCEKHQKFSSRQQSLKICGQLLSKQHRRRPVNNSLLYQHFLFKIFPIKPKGYNNDLSIISSQSPCLGITTIVTIIILKHQNNHLAKSPSNLVLFANVAVNVRWASIVVWHLHYNALIIKIIARRIDVAIFLGWSSLFKHIQTVTIISSKPK